MVGHHVTQLELPKRNGGYAGTPAACVLVNDHCHIKAPRHASPTVAVRSPFQSPVTGTHEALPNLNGGTLVPPALLASRRDQRHSMPSLQATPIVVRPSP